MQLTEAQKQAVMHIKGPMMVIAGPGSGKTAVITRRVQYMVAQAGIDPRQILVITFTRAAASEMRERYGALQGGIGQKHEVCFGTFHSVFYAILRKEHSEVWELMEEEEAVCIMSVYFEKQCHCARQEALWRASFLLSEYSRSINTDTFDWRSIRRYMSQEEFLEASEYYREVKRRLRKIDYDDMMTRLYTVFREEPGRLEHW